MFYLTGLTFSVTADSAHLNYERGKSAVFCRLIVAIISLFPPLPPDMTPVPVAVSGDVSVDSLDLIVNDIVGNRLSGFVANACKLQMASITKLEVTVESYQLFDGEISPMKLGRAFLIQWSPELLDISASPMKGNIDIETTARVVSTILQSPFVLTDWTGSAPPSEMGIQVTVASSLIGIPVSPGNVPDYLYLTIGGTVLISPTVVTFATKRIAICFAERKALSRVISSS
jgi:hypothetical protein